MQKAHILLILLGVFIVGSTGEPGTEEIEEEFKKFTAKYKKSYNSIEEKEDKYSRFTTNYKLMEEHNKVSTSYKLGVNAFADERTATSYGAPPPRNFPTRSLRSNDNKADPTIDWVKLGKVSGVKDQGNCMACWAFAGLAAVESMIAIHREVDEPCPSFSAQRMIDCDNQDGTPPNDGCKHGTVIQAFEYIKNKGVSYLKDWPFLDYQSVCPKVIDNNKVGFLDNITTIPTLDEVAMGKILMEQGPIVTTVDHTSFEFMYYQGGILDYGCGDLYRNHSVVIVGMGTEAGVPFWKIKNSWGKSWGEEGYIRIKRGLNLCGLAEDTMYPVPRNEEKEAKEQFIEMLSAGIQAGHPHIDNPHQQINDLQQTADGMRIWNNQYHRKIPGGHIQGIQFYHSPSEKKRFVYMSHDSTSETGYLIIAEYDFILQEAVTKKEFKLETDGKSPPLRHAGGFQIIHGFLAVGVEDNQDKKRSQIQFYDLADPLNPEYLPHLTVDRSGSSESKTAGAVGIVHVIDNKNERGFYILGVGNWDSKEIDFYITDNCYALGECSKFIYIYTMKGDGVDGWHDYQSINLFFGTDANGGLHVYLGGTATGKMLWLFDRNYIDVFQLDITSSQGEITFKANLEVQRRIEMKDGAAFRYGGGFLLVSDSHIQPITNKICPMATERQGTETSTRAVVDPISCLSE